LATKTTGYDDPAEFLGTGEDRAAEEFGGNDTNFVEQVIWAKLIARPQFTTTGGPFFLLSFSAPGIRQTDGSNGRFPSFDVHSLGYSVLRGQRSFFGAAAFALRQLCGACNDSGFDPSGNDEASEPHRDRGAREVEFPR
jgi:hypothetical protein